MKFLKKLYEQMMYSEYGELTMTSVTLTVLFVVAFFFESQVSSFLNKTGLANLPYIFEFSTIVMMILIISICSRSVKTSNDIRVVIYTVFFNIGLGFLFIAFTKVNWFTTPNNYNVLTFFTASGKFIVILGLLLGAVVNWQFKHLSVKKTVLTSLIFVIWGIISISVIFLNRHAEVLNLIDIHVRWYTLLEYFSAILLIITFALHFRAYNINKNRYTLKFINGVSVLIIAQVVRLTFMRYTYLYHFLYSLYVFIGYYYLYVSLFGYNVKGPVDALMSEEKQIKLYAENLEVIVDRRTTEMQSNNMRLIQEIEYAKSIQQSLLPPRKVNFNKVVFTSEYFPCERLSGDFFDIYRLDDDNIGMYVLDVSGHGVSAALMTMFCNNYIKSSEKLIMKYRGLKPHRNLKHFYEEFNKMNFPEEMYMVMFFAAYNLESQVLTYSSGGMNCYPMLMRKNGTKEYLDRSHGFPICKMSEFFTPTFTSETIQLDKGDRIIFYTDGLIDNVKNDTISQEVLEEVMYNYRDLSLKSLNNKIRSYINEDDGNNEDDITYFIMEI